MSWQCDQLYEPSTGVFTLRNWSDYIAVEEWVLDQDNSAPGTWRLSYAGTAIDQFTITPPGSSGAPDRVLGLLLDDDEYMLVHVSRDETSHHDHRLHVYHADSDGGYAAADHYVLPSGDPLTSTGDVSLGFAAAPDDSAFFIYTGQSSVNSQATNNHAIYRLADGKQLCGIESLVDTDGERRAEATSEGFTITAGAITNGCPFPRGRLDMTPAAQTFPDTVIGEQSTVTFTLENEGSDCLRVESIADDGPFSVIEFQVSGVATATPFDLHPVESATVTVAFAPTTTGVAADVLPITLAPDALNDDAPDDGPPGYELRCSGEGYEPLPSIGFNALLRDFGTQEANAASDPWTLTVRNDGQADLEVTNGAGGMNGYDTNWTALPLTVPPGDDADLATVRFEPAAEQLYSDVLTVTSNDPDSPHTVTLSGQGCVPEPELSIVWLAVIEFGEVERGFRSVRRITIRNDGDGTLELRARIDGPDAAPFGIQADESDSVTAVASDQTVLIFPESPCGDQPAGDGVRSFGVVFFADPDAPDGAIDAELVIERIQNDTWPPGAPVVYRRDLAATVLPRTPIDVGLVLDRSGSMTESSGEMERKTVAEVTAADLFVQLLREDAGPNDVRDRATAVGFNQAPDVFQPIVGIDPDTKSALQSAINSTQLSPQGSTSIAGGVMAALEQLETPRDSEPDALGKGLVILTDGKENWPFRNPDDDELYSIMGGFAPNPDDEQLPMVNTRPVLVPADVRIHAVAMGTEENVDFGRLEQLAGGTGGVYDVIGELEGQAYFDLAKRFVQAFVDVAGHEVVLDPIDTIDAGEKRRTPFDVTREDASALVVVYDKDGKRLPFRLLTPADEVIDPDAVPPGFQLRAGASDLARFVEVRMPQGEPERYAGEWALEVAHPGEICYGVPGAVAYPAEREAKVDKRQDDADRKWGLLPLKCETSRDPVEYSVTVGVGSDFRMQPYTTPGVVHVGEPLLLTAIVSEAGLPATDCTVTVDIVSPAGEEWTVTLADDGARDDGPADDGEYARAFTRTEQAGSYQLTFRARGRTRDGEPVTREATRAKYVEGRVPVTPHRCPPAIGTRFLDAYLHRLQRLGESGWDRTRGGTGTKR